MWSVNKIIQVSLFVINFLVVILALSFFYPKGMYYYFNSDALYAPVIFRGLFIDGSGLEGWNFNAAPNFFPDFLGYSLVNMIISDFKWAMVVFSGVQYAGLMILLTWLLYRVNRKITHIFAILGNVCMWIFFGVAVFAIDYYFAFLHLSISYHLGPFILTILSLVSISYLWREPRINFYYYLLLVTVFLGVLNNRLYIVMFIIPFLLSISVFYKKKKIFVQKVGLGAFISATLGMLGFWGMKQSESVIFISTGWKMFNFENIKGSIEVWWNQLSGFLNPLDLRGIIFLLSLISYLLMLQYVIKSFRKIFSNRENNLHFEDFYVVFFFVFIPIVFLVPIINGAYVGSAIIRYNIHVYYFSIFNWGYLFFKFFEQRIQTKEVLLNKISFTSLIALLVLLIAGIYLKRDSFMEFVQYKPDYVKRIDDFAAKHDVKYGTGSYWYSKTTTMFSDRDVRMYHLYSNFRTYHHSLNQNWFYDSGKGKHSRPDFRFIVTSDSASDSLNIRKLLGEPTIVEPFKNLRILKYPSYKFDKETRLPYLAEDE
ncbi:MAG: hypothetical protein ACOC10_06540 [Bacteroidota bacterium]